MWVLLLGLFDLLCRSLWFSYFFYFFLFFKVALVDVGLCRWWLVSVVAAVVVGGCCNLVVDVPVLLMVMRRGYIILM